MLSSFRSRKNSKNPYNLLEPLLLEQDMDTQIVTNKKEENLSDKDNTGKKFEEIKSPLRIINRLNPVSYPNENSFGIHQDSVDTVPCSYIKTKKNGSFVRGDYLEMMMLGAIKKLDNRLSQLEKSKN